MLESHDSFSPPGHCCDMCGKFLLLMHISVCYIYKYWMPIMKTFSKSFLDRLVNLMLVEDGWPGSQSYSYRTDENAFDDCEQHHK
jgi:hypothetical protein